MTDDLLDEPASDFALESTAGAEIRLSETLEKQDHSFLPPGPTVVVLFRGIWCSYCTEQLRTFDALEYDLWRHYNADVLPVTNEPIHRLKEMKDRFDLGLQLLSDPGLEVAQAYTGVQDSENHGPIPRPGTFIVDPGGIVRYEHVGEHIADRTYANKVRFAIKSYDYRDPAYGNQEDFSF